MGAWGSALAQMRDLPLTFVPAPHLWEESHEERVTRAFFRTWESGKKGER